MKQMKKHVLGMAIAMMMTVLLFGAAVSAKEKITGVYMSVPTVTIKGQKMDIVVSPIIYDECDWDEWNSLNLDFQKKAKVTFSVSNKKILKNLTRKQNKTFRTQNFEAKKAGTVVVKATVKYGKKTYKISRKIVVAAKSPLKSLTWGTKVAINKTGYTELYLNGAKKRKITMKANSGWKIKNVTYTDAYNGKDNEYTLERKNINKNSYSLTVNPKEDSGTLWIELADKKGNIYSYGTARTAYNQYTLTYGKMKAGTKVRVKMTQDGRTYIFAELQYKKKASSKWKINRNEGAFGTVKGEFKNIKDLKKKLESNPLKTSLLKASVKGKKLLIKAPTNLSIQIINPGKGTSLKKGK